MFRFSNAICPTQCDEAWPTCGPCQRAGCKCSGPPQSLFKFVEETPKTSTPPGLQQHNGAIVAARSHIFHKISLSHTPPEQVPGNRDSLLAAELITLLRSGEGTGYDLHFIGESVGIYPQLLASSSAFQDALEHMLSSYKSMRRNEPAGVDFKSYGKALSSLHSSYQDPTLRYAPGTLAATQLLNWSGAMFGIMGSSDYGVTHSIGIYGWVAGRGPPNPDTDNLHNTLYLDAAMFAMQASLYRNLPPFFRGDEWIGPFNTAVRNSMDVSGVTGWLYHLKIQMLHWPYLIQSVRRLHESVQDESVQDEGVQDEGAQHGPSASHLLAETVVIAESLQEIDVSFISLLRRRKDIREVGVEASKSRFPFRWTFDFASHQAAQLFVWHAMFSIVVSRVIEQLVGMLGSNTNPDPTFKSSYREWSRRIWLSYPFARKGKPLRTLYFLTPYSPLMMSFEAANAEERIWFMEAFYDMVGHRRPEGYQIVEENILYSVRAVTGREKTIWPNNKM